MPDSLPENRIDEMDYAAIFSTFMYTGYKDAIEGTTLKDIIDQMANSGQYKEGDEHYEEFLMVKNAVERDPQLGAYKIYGQSWAKDSSHSEANACIFADGNGNYYVAFRGTGDKEWIDNGEGMTAEATLQQERASRYFDDMAKKYGWSDRDNVIVCGHSKGGNKAQFITLNAENRDLIDSCYSYDGQGFSPEAIAAFKARYGEERYQQYLEKMYSLRGENDYVSGLGISIIPEEHTYFIHTREKATDFVGHHSIQNMLDPESGRLNPATGKQGPFSLFADLLSKEIMCLPEQQRRDYAMTIMQLMEMHEDSPFGYGGRHVTFEELAGFAKDGIPLLLNLLLFTEEGRSLLADQGMNLILEHYRKYGLRSAMFLGVTILSLTPLVLGFTNLTNQLQAMVNTLLHIYHNVQNVIDDTLTALERMLANLWKNIQDICDRLWDWVRGKDLSATYDHYTVSLISLQKTEESLENQSRKILNLAEDLKQIRSNLDFGIKAQLALSVKINACVWNLQQLADNLAKCAAVLDTAKEKYRSNEQRIAGYY